LQELKALNTFGQVKMRKEQMKLQAIGVHGEVLDEVIVKTKAR
jgi:hypothetical protein